MQIWTSTMVTGLDEQGVDLGEERLRARTAIWAAGVKPSRLNRRLEVALDPQGRAIVGPDLSLPEHPEVFVIGDQAHFAGPDDRPLPGLAPVAIQQGTFVAQALRRELREEARGSFRYRDKGQMATIGRSRAVCDLGRIRFAGFFAWLFWLLVHNLLPHRVRATAPGVHPVGLVLRHVPARRAPDRRLGVERSGLTGSLRRDGGASRRPATETSPVPIRGIPRVEWSSWEVVE